MTFRSARPMRRGFTLIELLAIIAIMGVMVAAAVVNVRGGQDGARLKGVVRDTFATIRHARSMALVSGQPSIITYSVVKDGDDPCAKIEIHTAKIFSANPVTKAQTLSGETVYVGGDEEGETGSVTATNSTAAAEGMGVDEYLFQPMKTELLRGIRLKVVKEGDELADYDEDRAKAKISVFSNVDYLLGKFSDAKKAAAAEEKSAAADGAAATAAADEDQEEVSVIWEVNGRTEPHKVWLYLDGRRYDEGLCISVDRFGAAKVLSADGEDGE